MIGDFAAQFGADVPVSVLNLKREFYGHVVGDGVLGFLDNFVIERMRMNAVVPAFQANAGHVLTKFSGDVFEDAAEADGVGLGVPFNVALFDVFNAADEVVQPAHAEAGHNLPDFIGDGVEEVNDVFFFAFELVTVFRVLGGDADRAGVQMALPDINAAHGDEGDGAKVKLFRTEDGGMDNVHATAETTISA